MPPALVSSLALLGTLNASEENLGLLVWSCWTNLEALLRKPLVLAIVQVGGVPKGCGKPCGVTFRLSL